jgi:hypothetical protein
VDEAGSELIECRHQVVITIGDLLSGKTFRIPLENITGRVSLALIVDHIVHSLRPPPGFLLIPDTLRRQVRKNWCRQVDNAV